MVVFSILSVPWLLERILVYWLEIYRKIINVLRLRLRHDQFEIGALNIELPCKIYRRQIHLPGSERTESWSKYEYISVDLSGFR